MAIQKGNSRTFNVSTDIDMNGNQINELADPSVSGDAANKNYVDTQVASVGGTDLSYVAATRTLESSTGDDVVLPLATSSDAGLMSANHFDRVEANPIQGFESLTDSTLSFDNGTRTVTLTHVSDWSYWVNGTKYTKTGNETYVIPDVEGIHYVYFDGSSMTSTQTFSYDIISTYAFVTEVYWDATNSKQILLADERHGINMTNEVHAYLHRNFGAQLSVGGALGDIVADGDGSSDTHIQFSNEATTVNDEDILFSHSARTSTATIPVYYRDGADSSGIWRVNETSSLAAITTGTGRAAYNELSGTTWVQTEVTNNQYTLSHVFVSNDTSRPYAIIQGQNEYATINAARTGAETEINSLILGGLPTLEFVFVGTIIIQTSNSYSNGAKSRIRTTSDGGDYIDLRGAVITRSGVAITVTDHNDLANIGTLTHDQLETAITNIEAKTDYITVTQAVDLDSVEALANDAVLNADTSTSAMGFVIDEDNMASDSATKVPTQQSTKAYADTKMGQNGGAHWDANSLKIQNVATPTAGGDAVNKTYADSVGGATNLGWTASSSEVTSDTGTNATLTVVDATNPGLMTVADKSKLDGIEASADVTDAANVDAAGAVMNSDTTTAGMSFVIDEDNMASNLDTKVPTQQSVKAYADSITGTTNLGYTASSSGGTVTSDTGTNATIPDATVTNAGLFTPSEKTKLTNIETLADKTDAANVAAAGAVMESDTTTAAMSFVVDEDNMSSDLATKVPTQQSVKAYVDNHPLMPKLMAVCSAGASPSLGSNTYGCSSVSRPSTGQYVFNFDGFTLTANDYTIVTTVHKASSAGSDIRVSQPNTLGTGSVQIHVWTGGGSATDDFSTLHVMIYSNE